MKVWPAALEVPTSLHFLEQPYVTVAALRYQRRCLGTAHIPCRSEEAAAHTPAAVEETVSSQGQKGTEPAIEAVGSSIPLTSEASEVKSEKDAVAASPATRQNPWVVTSFASVLVVLAAWVGKQLLASSLPTIHLHFQHSAGRANLPAETSREQVLEFIRENSAFPEEKLGCLLRNLN